MQDASTQAMNWLLQMSQQGLFMSQFWWLSLLKNILTTEISPGVCLSVIVLRYSWICLLMDLLQINFSLQPMDLWIWPTLSKFLYPHFYLLHVFVHPWFALRYSCIFLFPNKPFVTSYCYVQLKKSLRAVRVTPSYSNRSYRISGVTAQPLSQLTWVF